MTFLTTIRRWTHEDPMNWTRRAYGRNVMFESDGGTLKTVLVPEGPDAQIYIRAKVCGRMLVEIFCNGQLVVSDLFTNEDIDLFVDLAPFSDAELAEIELHFIPATNGTISISRDVQLTNKRGAIFAMESTVRQSPQPDMPPAPRQRGPQATGVLSKLRMLF